MKLQKSLVVFIWQALLFLELADAAVLIPRDPGPYVMNPSIVKWDKTCADRNPQNQAETKQDAIKRAWEGAMELAADAWARWQKTRPMLEKMANANKPPTLRDQLEVQKEDPAYIQFFAMDYQQGTITRVNDVLNMLNTRINALPGQNGRPVHSPFSVRCNQTRCKPDVLASTRSKANAKSSINFCDPFFEQPRFDVWKKAAMSGSHAGNGGPAEIAQSTWDTVRDLTKYEEGTQAATIYHELSHVTWMGDTNPIKAKRPDPPEIYGWYETAEEAKNCLEASNNCRTIIENADSYTWYAEYGYFRGHVTMAAEIWPLSGPQTMPITLPI